MYDPMVAKLIVWDADREQATARMLRALEEYEIEGLTTLIPFHKALLSTEDWAKGSICKDLVEDKGWLKSTADDAQAPFVPEDDEEIVENTYTVEVSGKRFDVKVFGAPPVGGVVQAGAAGAAPSTGKKREKRGPNPARGGGGGADRLDSPMQGNMWKIAVAEGDTVEEGQLICIIEAMKMENEIVAHKAGTVSKLHIAEGDPITGGAPIADITSAPAAE